ncbi:unnamed protein product [Lupinus luteus]|uniref:Uncharacterized protein n=1 Tax=Lupinus luteus TaxID=3873 RepID=A0AAV1WKE5_LUPLU
MGFVEGNKETGESSVEGDKSEGTHDSLSRQPSESSVYATDQEEEDEDGNKIELGPQCTLKEQLEKDKFLDDDNKCYLEINYTFDIRKEWA